MKAKRHPEPVLWGLMGLAVAGLALHALWLGGLFNGPADTLINDGVYNGVLVLAAAICLIKAARSRSERWIWLAFGVGLAAWTAGDIYWTAALSEVKKPPYPSLADAGYLLAYPACTSASCCSCASGCASAAAAWLDGAIGGLAVAAIAIAILSPALVGSTKGDAAEVATNLAYPLGDVLLLSFLIAGVAVVGLRAGRSWLLIGVGIATWGVADAIYLYQDRDLDLRRRIPRLAVAGRRARGRRRGDRLEALDPRAPRRLLDAVPGAGDGGRGRRPRLGPLRTALRALAVAGGGDDRSGAAAPDALLPPEPDAARRRPTRRRHRCAHRARQPALAALRPGPGDGGGAASWSSRSSTSTVSRPTTTASGTPRATCCCAASAATWRPRWRPRGGPSGSAATSSASSSPAAASGSRRCWRSRARRSPSAARASGSAPRRVR